MKNTAAFRVHQVVEHSLHEWWHARAARAVTRHRRGQHAGGGRRRPIRSDTRTMVVRGSLAMVSPWGGLIESCESRDPVLSCRPASYESRDPFLCRGLAVLHAALFGARWRLRRPSAHRRSQDGFCRPAGRRGLRDLDVGSLRVIVYTDVIDRWDHVALMLGVLGATPARADALRLPHRRCFRLAAVRLPSSVEWSWCHSAAQPRGRPHRGRTTRHCPTRVATTAASASSTTSTRSGRRTRASTCARPAFDSGFRPDRRGCL
jgi:hypothetical protein